MSHLLCKCGYDIRDTSYRPTHVARLVTYDWSTHEALVYKSREVVECPGCLRLLVQRVPGIPGYVYYFPDDEPLNLVESRG